MSKIFAKTWDHEAHEKTIYADWEQSGKFKPEVNPNGKKFVVSMPPPNVTGKLHIGHALFVSIQDLMIRYHRLRGDAALWVPGTDHAGIATQSVVDKALRKQGINKNELGREKFVEQVWKWKDEYGGTINKQIRAVGASCDWSRERFTLDEGLSEAVNTAFEFLCDVASPEFHPLVEKAKNIAAAAVLICAVGAASVGLLVFLPRLLLLFRPVP